MPRRCDSEAVDRPKCTGNVGSKVPIELKLMLQHQAALRTQAMRIKNPSSAAVTESEVLKERLEFGLAINLALQLGFYRLYDLVYGKQSESGLTIAEKV